MDRQEFFSLAELHDCGASVLNEEELNRIVDHYLTIDPDLMEEADHIVYTNNQDKFFEFIDAIIRHNDMTIKSLVKITVFSEDHVQIQEYAFKNHESANSRIVIILHFDRLDFQNQRRILKDSQNYGLPKMGSNFPGFILTKDDRTLFMIDVSNNDLRRMSVSLANRCSHEFLYVD